MSTQDWSKATHDELEDGMIDGEEEALAEAYTRVVRTLGDREAELHTARAALATSEAARAEAERARDKAIAGRDHERDTCLRAEREKELAGKVAALEAERDGSIALWKLECSRAAVFISQLRSAREALEAARAQCPNPGDAYEILDRAIRVLTAPAPPKPGDEGPRCKPGCGQPDVYGQQWSGFYAPMDPTNRHYCTPACRDAGRPLHPPTNERKTGEGTEGG